MSDFDFSSNNPVIKEFLTTPIHKAPASYPVSELLYLHIHPLIKDNFIKEIEAKVHSVVGKLTLENNRSLVERILELGIRLGKLMPELDNGNREVAQDVLEILRELYQRCGGLEDVS